MALQYKYIVLCVIQILFVSYLSPPDMGSLQVRFSESQTEVQTQDKKLRKSEKANRRLQEELSSLQEHVQTSTVTHSQMGAYKQQVEEKVCLLLPPSPAQLLHENTHTHTHTHTHTVSAGDVSQAG